MSLASFLSSLREHGRPKVPPPVRAETPAELGQAAAILAEMEREARLEAPGDPPAYAPDLGLWAALTLYRASQAFVHRELGSDDVHRLLSAAPPIAQDPASAAWSADLALRWLPDLVACARGVSEDDPLVLRLLALARDWPLSSVGVRGLDRLAPGAAAEHPTLLRLYIDRILDRRDASRLADPRVAEAARVAIGAHPELAPEIAAALAAETAP
jgi:hypothetical protein